MNCKELNPYVEVESCDYPCRIENRNIFVLECSNLIVVDEKLLKEKFNLNAALSYTKLLVACARVNS